MRRISRARSIVSGVELWHPAKPLLENRVEFVHCIVIIMHCLPKLFSQSRFVSKRPIFYSNAKHRVSGIIFVVAIGLQMVFLKQIKFIFIFSGAVERAD